MSFFDRLRALVSPTPAPPPETDPQIERALVMLRTVIDPELGIDVVSMGLIREITVRPIADAPAETFGIDVKMTLSTRGCPVGPLIVKQVETALTTGGFQDPAVSLIWDPPWTPEDIDPATRAAMQG